VNRFDAYVVVQPGLEAFTLEELRRLGIRGKAVTGGIDTSVTLSQLLLLNLWSRTATRVLVRIARFAASSFPDLEGALRRVDLAPFIAQGVGTAVRASSHESTLFHTGAIEERVHELCGLFLDAEEQADQTLYVRVLRNVVTVSVDSTGGALHRRGYRLETAKAPLRENLAAALLMASGWDRRSPLVDPMCGAGTIAIEAALMAANRAPGRDRDLACHRWPMMTADIWPRLCAAADADALNRKVDIVGRDRDGGAIAASQGNAERARVTVTWEQQPISEPLRAGDKATVVTNPPYGDRIARGRDLRDLYDSLRTTVGVRRLAVIAPDGPLVRRLGVESVARTHNGPIEVAFFAREPGAVQTPLAPPDEATDPVPEGPGPAAP
jgi:putative N6-adenine-specific DNA methylase